MRWGSCLLVVVVLTSGCASLGWRYWTKERTYTYEREVSVEVQSEPAGATIVDETGNVVGKAPMTLVTRHPVKRTRSQRSTRSVLLGCLANLVVGGYLLATWVGNASESGTDPMTGFPTFETDLFTSNLQRFRLLGWSAALMDCAIVALPPALEGGRAKSQQDSAQVQERPYSRDVVREKLGSRRTTIEARWADWKPVKVEVEVPGTSGVTIRRGHTDTFDDALVRRVRSGGSLGPDGTHRAALAFLAMARETKDPAHARMAIDLFERYKAAAAADDPRRAEVERLLVELAAVAKGTK